MTQTPHTSNSILLIGLILRRSAALRPSPTLQSVATVCGPPGLSRLHWSGAAVPGPSGGWGWGGTGVERSCAARPGRARPECSRAAGLARPRWSRRPARPGCSGAARPAPPAPLPREGQAHRRGALGPSSPRPRVDTRPPNLRTWTCQSRYTFHDAAAGELHKKLRIHRRARLRGRPRLAPAGPAAPRSESAVTGGPAGPLAHAAHFSARLLGPT